MYVNINKNSKETNLILHIVESGCLQKIAQIFGGAVLDFTAPVQICIFIGEFLQHLWYNTIVCIYAEISRCVRQNGRFSFMAKNDSKAASYKKGRAFIDLILSLAIAGTCGYFIKGAVDRSKLVEPSNFIDNTDLEEAKLEADKADPSKTVFEDISIDNQEVYKGDLILVNNDHQYFSGGEDLIGIAAMNERNNVESFSVVDYEYTILRNVYDPMVKMLDAFYKEYNNDTVQIYGSYRTTEFQQQLYEEDLAMTGSEDSTRVAKPGFSEHETGYAFDLTETVTGDYQGTGDYAWINANCYKYGFIERYKEDKTDLTKIQPEPWHFRYVGKPHAYYMLKNNLCLEEYITLISQFVYGEHHMEFTDDEGKNYEIYYVPADMSSGSTNVPVPAGKKYDISGNNVDGFIVTLYKNGEDYIQAGEDETETPSAPVGYTTGGNDADAENAEETSEESAEPATEEESAPAEEAAE